MPYRPLANGTRTAHPIPGLPFVDDAALNLENPDQIEAIGRHRASEDMWGRMDYLFGSDTDWTAFTTIPEHPDLAWIVRHYEAHGTTVVLVGDDDAAGMQDQDPRLVLVRSGGYWWDGSIWHRPGGTVDPVTGAEHYEPVPEARTVTVADALRLAQPHEPKGPTPLSEITPNAARPSHEATTEWVLNDLPAWLGHHEDPADWDRAVVTFAAPETTTAQMLTATGVAQRAGISENTVRSYLNRGQMPEAQTRVPAIMWSTPVIDHWRHTVETSRGVRVELDEAAGPLGGIAEDVRRISRGLGRRKSAADINAALCSTLARNTLGLSGATPGKKAETLARNFAAELHEVMGRLWLADQAAHDLILLIETAPFLAAEAVTRAVRIRLDTAQAAAEARYDKANAAYWQGKARVLAGEAEGSTAEVKYGTSDYKLAEIERDKAKKVQDAIADGTERRRIEEAFAIHPYIRARTELVRWMEHTLSARGI